MVRAIGYSVQTRFDSILIECTYAFRSVHFRHIVIDDNYIEYHIQRQPDRSDTTGCNIRIVAIAG